MLLESALADFSTDESDVFEDAEQHSGVGFDWDTPPGKSNSPSTAGRAGSSSDGAPGHAEIKRVYLDPKFPQSRRSRPELGTVHESRKLGDFLGMSRSPPAVDVNSGTSFEISRADEVPVQDNTRSAGKEALPGRLKSPRKSLIAGRGINSGFDKGILHENMPFMEDAGTVPFAWETQPGKLKLQKGTSSHQAKQSQLPPTRVIPMFQKGKGVSSPSSQEMEYTIVEEQLQQQGRASSSPKGKGISPILQSTKIRPLSGNGKQIKTLDLSKSSPVDHSRLENNHNTSDAGLCDNSMNSEYKYYEEESPVSTLQRPPSPPTTNSSGSSGSSVHSPPRPPSAAPLPPVALPRRRLPSFSSSSAHDSPRASTSSSSRYMGQCLVALQEALAIDPEKSRRFEDSFVELDTYVEGEESRPYGKSVVVDDDDDDDDDDDNLGRNAQRGGSPAWARGAAASYSELEPEYNTMDFYIDSEEEVDDRQSRASSIASSRASSLARSSSGSSISKPIRRSLNYHHPVSVENYSLKDKRFLSSHPSSWVEGGDDSVSSSLTNSKCNTMTRHQEISWDEQQADLDSVKAEEVIRGAMDGLRFTYSPVSSAFVFTRSNEGDEEGAASGRKGYGRYSPHNRTFTESEASRRFSISLDYESSLRSEDSLSFARASDVTELGVSRAESWSKVARGIAIQQGYQDAIPSSFIRRAGNAPMFEDGNRSNKKSTAVLSGAGLGDGSPDSRLVRKRLAKKSTMTTCLPFRSILRNFKTIGSPARSRLGPTPNDGDRPSISRPTN